MPPTRRNFLKTAGEKASAAAMAGGLMQVRRAGAQTGAVTRTVQTKVLQIGYLEWSPAGSAAGMPVFLLHGFPDDVHAYDDVAPPLARAGYRVIVPYLRGYGPTTLLDRAAPKMGEQAAIGQDLIDLADALKIERFAVSGYDWGGRASAVAAALHPERVRAAVLIGGSTIQDTVRPSPPAAPEAEQRFWYQWYFNTERGRAGLAANRHDFCKLLWKLWSPNWHFTDATYERTAPSFDNPDFVDIVIHSYRHRIGNAPGEARFLAAEKQLAERPKIQCPAIALYGAEDGLARPAADSPSERVTFPALQARRVVEGAGHFMPREKPDAVSGALLELLAQAK